MSKDTDGLVGVSVISLISWIFSDFTARLRAASLLLVIPCGRTERITPKKYERSLACERDTRICDGRATRGLACHDFTLSIQILYIHPLIHLCFPFTSKLPYNQTEKLFINELYLFKKHLNILNTWRTSFFSEKINFLVGRLFAASVWHCFHVTPGIPSQQDPYQEMQFFLTKRTLEYTP